MHFYERGYALLEMIQVPAAVDSPSAKFLSRWNHSLHAAVILLDNDSILLNMSLFCLVTMFYDYILHKYSQIV
jgi:predicted alpha/beta hydrolase family esterase